MVQQRNEFSVPSFRLDGQRALVTGAGRGLGRVIAGAFAASGAHVTLSARSSDEIEEAANDIRNAGFHAEVMVADVTDVRRFVELVAARPAFNIFVNNAGTNRPKPLSEVTEEDFDAVLGLNLRAAIFAAKAVTARMVEQGVSGSVINVSSQMGHVGAENRTLYCASKWGLEGFSKALALELATQGIRVNTICPTFIETPMTAPFFREESFRKEVLSKIPLGRIGQVDEVIGAALYLASNASSLTTGSSIMLDGGWTAH